MRRSWKGDLPLNYNFATTRQKKTKELKSACHTERRVGDGECDGFQKKTLKFQLQVGGDTFAFIQEINRNFV